ncbi:MAG: DNA-directed RNA polymerase subunit alpha [Candidatus Pacebacteria bacterium]|nr:DNA-directed RNA polymerase subunit alpha [Candidatus Paceibacterota bacterium]
MPQALEIDENTASDVYAKFVAEPWEKGFGHTVGNALRRVLLSSLDGIAVSTVRIDGVPHEFTTISDVIEDVTEVILNIKKLRFRCEGDLPRTLELYADKAGPVTGGNIREDGVTDVLNKDQVVCTLDRDRPVRMEIEIDRGRGYRPAEENKREDQPIGVIPVDCIFSPVERVRYHVQACRVGQRTDYDRLELEVWTDGRVTPDEAVRNAASIIQEHLNVFTQVAGTDEAEEQKLTPEEQEMLEKMCSDVKALELSVRARNCLHNAAIGHIGELIQKTESEMLKYRNFGKKSLQEIKEKLTDMGLSLEMDIPEHLQRAMEQRIQKELEEE